MLLSIIIILLLLGIASIHYVQGLFSATVSAVCAGLAAFAAFAFHEQLASVGGGALGSYGDAVALVVLFAGVYLVLRVVIDNAFAGNVRFPVALEKVGAALMGLVAGFFATAIIALAAQMLPFSPGPIFHTRYATADGEISAPRRLAFAYKIDTRKQGSDLMDVRDAVVVERLGTEEAKAEANNLWVPVDSLFLGLVGTVSGPSGSLAGPVAFTSRYPDPADDFKDALFGRIIGVQTGAKRAAVNTAADQQVTVPEQNGLFLLTTGPDAAFPDGIPQTDGDERDDRSRNVTGTYRPAGDAQLLVVRALFSSDAADKGGYVRFSPGTARLVAGGRQYFPIGTLESGRILVVNKPDDYLISAAGADFVYEVEPDALADGGVKMASDAYFEFKELADVDLAGRRVGDRVVPNAATHIVRKRLLQERLGAIFEGVAADDYNTLDGFNALRDTVAEAPAEPAEESDVPADDDDEPAEGNGGGMLDNLRDGVNERNEELGGPS